MSEVLKRRVRCAVYTRKSTDEGMDQEYNSIDAQRDAGHAYIASQRAEGWIPVVDDYDDPAFSGGHMERPALR
ncbi:MAG TPA: recombinase family protein, partial [Accumulibacter sp.]|uniref:recombinase family protein n=1 Tax=Accumulibacter sp. TaxID=2053492 RepID=UPI002C4E59B6